MLNDSCLLVENFNIFSRRLDEFDENRLYPVQDIEEILDVFYIRSSTSQWK